MMRTRSSNRLTLLSPAQANTRNVRSRKINAALADSNSVVDKENAPPPNGNSNVNKMGLSENAMSKAATIESLKKASIGLSKRMANSAKKSGGGLKARTPLSSIANKASTATGASNPLHRSKRRVQSMFKQPRRFGKLSSFGAARRVTGADLNNDDDDEEEEEEGNDKSERENNDNSSNDNSSNVEMTGTQNMVGIPENGSSNRMSTPTTTRTASKTIPSSASTTSASSSTGAANRAKLAASSSKQSRMRKLTSPMQETPSKTHSVNKKRIKLSNSDAKGVSQTINGAKINTKSNSNSNSNGSNNNNNNNNNNSNNNNDSSNGNNHDHGHGHSNTGKKIESVASTPKTSAPSLSTSSTSTPPTISTFKAPAPRVSSSSKTPSSGSSSSIPSTPAQSSSSAASSLSSASTPNASRVRRRVGSVVSAKAKSKSKNTTPRVTPSINKRAGLMVRSRGMHTNGINGSNGSNGGSNGNGNSADQSFSSSSRSLSSSLSGMNLNTTSDKTGGIGNNHIQPDINSDGNSKKTTDSSISSSNLRQNKSPISTNDGTSNNNTNRKNIQHNSNSNGSVNDKSDRKPVHMNISTPSRPSRSSASSSVSGVKPMITPRSRSHRPAVIIAQKPSLPSTNNNSTNKSSPVSVSTPLALPSSSDAKMLDNASLAGSMSAHANTANSANANTHTTDPQKNSFSKPKSKSLSAQSSSTAAASTPVAPPKINPMSTPVNKKVSSSTATTAKGKEGEAKATGAAAAATKTPRSSSKKKGSAGSGAKQKDEIFMVNKRPYFVISLLGSGGSSKVYKVLSKDKKIYALKVIALEKETGLAHVANYRNEIALLKKLRGQPHVIQLIDAEEALERHEIFMVFEFGQMDLAQVIKRNSRIKAKTQNKKPTLAMDENTVRYYWEAILRCVKACHESKVIHLDLKPPNFVFVDGRLKIIDFGIAKQVGNNTTNIIRESQVGTLNYMSPESILESNQNAPGQFKLARSSDVWSLGCILYQMVYGHPPFSHLKFIQKLHSITDPNYPIAFPETAGFGNDAALFDCLKNCLNRNPKRRPSIDHLLQHPFLHPSKHITALQHSLALSKKKEESNASGGGNNSSTNGNTNGTSITKEQLSQLIARLTTLSPAQLMASDLSTQLYQKLSKNDL